MADKMYDAVSQRIIPSLSNLGRVLGVRKAKWHTASSYEAANQLAQIFQKMLRFVKSHRRIFDAKEFQSFAGV